MISFSIIYTAVHERKRRALKRVCFLTNNICQMGGIERVISLLSYGFENEKELSLTVLSLHSQPGDKVYFELSDETECIHAGCSLEAKADGFLIDFFCSSSYDVLITFHPGIALTIARIKHKINPIRWIATEHSNPMQYTWKRRLINILAYGRAEKLVALTAQIAEFYRKRLVKTTVIPNPVSFICDGTSSYPKRILAVGRIEEVKNYDLLIKAFGSIEEKHPEWILRIVGDGSYFDRIKQEAGKYAHIEMLGQRKEVRDLMMDSSFLVISSHYEGFPLVAIEALECGLPIVSTQLPAIHSMTDGFQAVLYAEQNDWQDLAGKMEKMICDEELVRNMGNEAKRCAEQYHIENIMPLWKELIEL